MAWTTSRSPRWRACSDLRGLGCKPSLDAQGVHQLINPNMEHHAGGKGHAGFDPAGLVEKSERDQAARHRVGLVDQVLQPCKSIGSTRGSDVQASLDETVGKLRQAVTEAERHTEQPGIDPVVIKRRERSQTPAV